MRMKIDLSPGKIRSIAAGIGLALLAGVPAAAAELPPDVAAAESPAAFVEQEVQDAADLIYQYETNVTFYYLPGGIYRIYCKPGYLTDIKLHPGEAITFIGGGDTSRWVIDAAQAGSGDNQAWHVYLKPVKEGIETNLIINTTGHSYQLQVRAGDWFNPIVNWAYNQEIKIIQEAARERDAQRYVDSDLPVLTVDNINFGYTVVKNKLQWSPTAVFDDGVKTYIKMPPSMNTANAPVLFVKTGKTLSLVNYRLKHNYFIVDLLFDEAELHASPKEIVKIKRKNAR